jgi:hypothetical protein
MGLLQTCMTFRNTLSSDFITNILNYCTMSSSLFQQNVLTLQACSLRLWHVFCSITVAKHIGNFYMNREDTELTDEPYINLFRKEPLNLQR